VFLAVAGGLKIENSILFVAELSDHRALGAHNKI
jgi:hypothetical protein